MTCFIPCTHGHTSLSYKTYITSCTTSPRRAMCVLSYHSGSSSQVETRALDTRKADLYRAAWGNVAAIDVEFSHFFSEGAVTIVCPAQVALVALDETVLYNSIIRPPTDVLLDWYIGGVAREQLCTGCDLATVQNEVNALLEGIDILAGFSLQADLDKLGLQVPRSKCRCLLTYDKLRTRKGAYRKLKEIVRDLSGQDIQQIPGKHDAVEDAKATMLLFRDFIMSDASQLSGTDLDSFAYHDLLQQMPTR